MFTNVGSIMRQVNALVGDIKLSFQCFHEMWLFENKRRLDPIGGELFVKSKLEFSFGGITAGSFASGKRCDGQVPCSLCVVF